MRNAKSRNSAPGIDQYREELVLFLRRRVPPHQVEDFTQQTLLNVHAYVGNGNTLDKPLAFIYETAKNVIRKSHRDQKMVALTDNVEDIEAVTVGHGEPSAEHSATWELEFEGVCEAIGRLPEQCRKAFVLRKVYQYSYQEIAEHCGISVNTVKTYVKRGFKLVQSYYERSL